MAKKILIQPLGLIPDNIIEILEDTLSKQFSPCKILLGKAIDLPTHAYDESRNQYNSPKIISWIEENCDTSSCDKILGISDVDAYWKDTNFIFGEAQIEGKICSIYLDRLKENSENKKNNEDLLLQRVVKEAVHELGHVFGLKHCKFTSCVMYFSNNLNDTDSKENEMCGKCNIMLKRIMASAYL